VTEHAWTPDRVGARKWFAVGLLSLALSGVLALLLVIGRLPVLHRFFQDPMFFRRCLVVHVDLALLVWLYAVLAGVYRLLPGPDTPTPRWRAHLPTAAVGGIGLMLVAALSGAEPILANYVPVIDHPIFLMGLAVFAVSVVVSFLDRRALRPARTAAAGLSDPSSPVSLLPPPARIGVLAAGFAFAMALLTLTISAFTLPSFLTGKPYFELLMWGAGHVLQFAGVSAMVAVWLALLYGWTDGACWRPGTPLRRAAPWLFGLLILPLVAAPFLALSGATSTTYHLGFTTLLRIPGHFHATVVGGTTLAFMALCYYVVPLIFRREYSFRGLIKLQPWLFGIGITLMSVGMSFAGSYGVPRRHWDVQFSGSPIEAGFDSGAHVMLGLLGVGGTIAFVGLLIFLLTTVHAVFLGKKNNGAAMAPWTSAPVIAAAVEDDGHEEHKTPGTMALVLLLLVSFAVYYFANWKALADVWHVR